MMIATEFLAAVPTVENYMYSYICNVCGCSFEATKSVLSFSVPVAIVTLNIRSAARRWGAVHDKRKMVKALCRFTQIY